MRSAEDLLTELNAADESPRIEAKRSREIGKSIIETVLAFANEPGLGGGHLLLGVDSRVDGKGDTQYWPEGLADPDKIQKDLACQCASMLNVAIRPEMGVERLDGKTLIVVFVPEVDVSQKPVYIKATGLPKGAFRRIGSTDQRCTDEDLWVLRGASQPQFGPDMAPVPDARMDDLDPQAIAEYRRLRALANPQAEELGYDNPDIAGAGSRTYYTLPSPRDALDWHPEQGELSLEGGNRRAEGGKQSLQGGKRTLSDLPPSLAARLPRPGQRINTEGLRQIIRDLCGWRPLRGEELAALLHKDLKYLRNKHLTGMVRAGELAFLYPESPNHALQAYLLPGQNEAEV